MYELYFQTSYLFHLVFSSIVYFLLGRYSKLSGYPLQVLVPVGFILLSLTRFSYSHHPAKVCPVAFVLWWLLHGHLRTEAADIRSAAWPKTPFPTMHSTHCLPHTTPGRHLGAQRLRWSAPYASWVWTTQGKAKPYQSFLRSRSSLSPSAPSRYRLYSCHLTSLVSLLTGLQTGKSRARKAHISQSASCSDTELRLCLNNLYLPPDTRIDIIWVPGTAALPTRSEAP